MVAVHAEVDIHADAAAVLAVLADLPDYPAWSPVHKAAHVDSVDDAGRPRRATMRVTAAGLADEQVLDYEWSDLGVRWSLVKAGQQRGQHGSYRLREHGGATHVSYDLDIEPSIPVPGFLVRQVMKKAVTAATEGLRRRVESLV
ncbi:MAG: SRPBCC family protein [Jatrophihabitans sp.]|uniref:SRPBCC family protein n=1 Tax=Jatrophihabitans sp. TaxID=1932789 RepID=UPI003F81C7A4